MPEDHQNTCGNGEKGGKQCGDVSGGERIDECGQIADQNDDADDDKQNVDHLGKINKDQQSAKQDAQNARGQDHGQYVVSTHNKFSFC